MDLAILLFIVDMSMKYRKFRQYRSVDEIRCGLLLLDFKKERRLDKMTMSECEPLSDILNHLI